MLYLPGPAAPSSVSGIFLDNRGNMMTILLLLAGLICFALFFKAIDFFDKI
jgi:hypothetical protein